MRLIDADELLRLSHRFHISEFDRDGVEIIYADTVRNAPTVEAQKTGKWIIFPPCIEEICMCSNCKTKFKEAYQHRDTCPSCGAKMEVGE